MALSREVWVRNSDFLNQSFPPPQTLKQTNKQKAVGSREPLDFSLQNSKVGERNWSGLGSGEWSPARDPVPWFSSLVEPNFKTVECLARRGHLRGEGHFLQSKRLNDYLRMNPVHWEPIHFFFFAQRNCGWTFKGWGNESSLTWIS